MFTVIIYVQFDAGRNNREPRSVNVILAAKKVVTF